MENQQNKEPRDNNGAKNKSGGSRSSHNRSRGGGHRRSQNRRPQEGAEHKPREQAAPHTEQEEGAVAPREAKEKAPRQPQKQNASRSSGRGRSGRSKGNAHKGEDAARQSPAEKNTQSNAKRRGNRDSVELPEMVIAPNLRGGLFDSMDRLQEDSFLPLHEEYRPDPEAERFAAEVLDAEGPLLGVQEMTDEAAEAEESASEQDEPTVEIVGIRFRSTGKMYYFDPGALRLKVGSFAVVETARGLEYGEVCRSNTLVAQSLIVPPLRPVIRAATAEDARHFEENQTREMEAFRICQEKIAAHGLDMKLVEAEYTFDNTKLLFYFTSAGRVDFRELVKDLAGVFRTRIELRQIGIRDEAKLLGGLGTCGRALCCASFLADFVQVSIKMAKEQNLSLNSTKISGACGRLMCCLRYEADTYEEEIRRTPAPGSLLRTPDGEGTVLSTNPLAGRVRVRLAGEEASIKEYHRDTVEVIKRAEPPSED